MTTEWTAEQERRLSYYEPLLRQHPAQDAYGTNPDYRLFPIEGVGIGSASLVG